MKKLVLFLCLCLLLLCSASVVFGRGTLSDLDGFETYFGKSKSVVRVIAPNYSETSDGKSYFVDYVDNGNNGYVALVVDFNENDVASFINVVIDSDTVKNELGGDLYRVFSFGIYLLGIDSADLIDIEEDEDGSHVYGRFKGAIACGCYEADSFYNVLCTGVIE